jgi:YD repeat-containing protein
MEITWRFWIGLGVFAVFAALNGGGAARAQNLDDDFKPRNFVQVDANGVDVAERKLSVGHTISIGSPANGGMTYSVTHTSDSSWNFYRSSMPVARLQVIEDPEINFTYYVWTLFYEGQTEYFDWVDLVQPDVVGDLGSRLTFCRGPYSFCLVRATRSDGTVLTVENTDIQFPQPGGVYYLRVLSAVKPNGERLDFHYLPGWPYVHTVTNNHGYQLRFEQTAGRVNSIVLFNMAVDPCAPTAATCPAFSRAWPRLSIEYETQVLRPRAITETGGARTVYTYFRDGRYIETIDGPGTRDMGITYEDCGRDELGGCQAGADKVGGVRVKTVTRGGRTWTYNFDPSIAGHSQHGVRVTMNNVTGSVGYTSNVKLVIVGGDPYPFASRVVTVRDALGRTTNMEYDGALNPRLRKITYPEGNGAEYLYDQRINVQSIRRFAKPGSGLADSTVTITRGEAGSTTQCAQAAFCNKPVLVRDARGYVTRRTWNVTTDLLESEERGLQGPDANLTCYFGTNLCPKTLFGYSALNAYFYNDSGLMSAGTPMQKLTSINQCELTSTCSPNDQIIITMGYGPTGAANNLLMRAKSVGKGGTIHSTSFGYDAVGNRNQIDGPRTDVSDITTFFWDLDRRLTDEIRADLTGIHSTYTPEGYPGNISRGVYASQSNPQFTASETTENVYDTAGNLVFIKSPAGRTQHFYNSANRLECTAIRMNPGVADASLPDACTLSTAGEYGPDRITHNIYDPAGQLTTIQRAYRTSLEQNYATYLYTSNGKQDWVQDANGNRTDFSYDGFDRLNQVNFPQPALGAQTPNASDYEHYDYDANDNRTGLRLRSGETITYTYDALNRETLRNLPDGDAFDVYSTYDLLGRRLSARFQSTSGAGVIYTYDAWSQALTESAHGRTMEYRYDEAGNRTRITWPDTNYVQYTYDSVNRMDQVRRMARLPVWGCLRTMAMTRSAGAGRSRAAMAQRRLITMMEPGGQTV